MVIDDSHDGGAASPSARPSPSPSPRPSPRPPPVADADTALQRRLAAQGYLTAYAAHELNNLNMVVTGHLDLLTQFSDRDDEALAKCRQAAWRHAELMRSLTALGAPDQALPLASILATVLDLLQQRLRAEQVAVELAVGDAVPLAGEPLVLAQIFFQIFLNALESLGTSLPKRLAVRAESIAGQLQVEVQDNGRGMNDQQLRQACSPGFSDLDHPQRRPQILHARGFGLSMCRDLVNELGGTLQLRSESGVGTTVTLRLPLATPPAIVGTLLVADSEVTTGERVASLLAPQGFCVHSAGTPARASEVLEAQAVDLVLLDDRTYDRQPDAWRRALAARPLVLLEAGGEPRRELPAPLLVRAHLHRPFDLQALQRAIAAPSA